MILVIDSKVSRALCACVLKVRVTCSSECYNCGVEKKINKQFNLNHACSTERVEPIK